MSAVLPASAGAATPPAASVVAAPHEVLALARTRAGAAGGGYAGAVRPPEAWLLVASGAARLVDVRTHEELRYVGRVPGALHVEWAGEDPARVERFLAALRREVRDDETVLFLCRSAVRSHHAARVACGAGYARAFNVLEGFEGRLDHTRQRGRTEGWRWHGLPWIQD